MIPFGRLITGALAISALALAPRTDALTRDAVDDAVRHFKLDKSDPAQGATLAKAPTELRFWFTQKPVLKTMSVKLTGPAAKAISLGVAWTADSTEKIVAVAVKEGLADGAYKIAWRAMANDGHMVNGQIAFTVRSAAAARTSRY